MAMLFIPENFDLENHVSKYPVDHIHRYHPEKLYYLLHIINDTAYRNPDNVTENGYVRLHSKLLKKAFAEYKEHMEYLIKTGIVQSDKSYVVGEKAIGFRLSDPYRNSDLKPVPVTKPTLKKKIAKMEYIEPNVRTNYPHLAKWFESGKLEIDLEAAKSYNRHLFREKVKRNNDAWGQIYRLVGGDGTKEDYNAFDVVTKPLAPDTIGIYRLAMKHYIMSIDDTVGRLHTNLTNLKSELRNTLSYDGQELVGLDVSNCQPLLTLVLFEPWFWDSTLPIKGSDDDTYRANIPKTPVTLSTLLSSIPTTNILATLPSLNMFPLLEEVYNKEDVALYRSLCMEGKLYGYIKEKMQEEALPVPENAKALKSVVFTVLFTSNHFYGQNGAEPKRVFKKLFPNVMRVFEAIKSGSGNKSRLPILLQRMESHLFLEIITKHIDAERPDVVQFTVHDSIITVVKHKDYVHNVIKTVFKDRLGLDVNVKREHFSISNLPAETLKLTAEEKVTLSAEKQCGRTLRHNKRKKRTTAPE